MSENGPTDQVCCTLLDTSLWDEKTHVWKDKPFIKESIPLLWHIPWPPMIGRMMTRMWGKVTAAGAAPATEDFLVLACDPSPWRCEWHMTTTKQVPDAENVTISGTFFSKVFDGPYSAVPKWIKAMDGLLAGRNQKALKYYFHYSSCPKCAKKLGHNYVVAFARIGP